MQGLESLRNLRFFRRASGTNSTWQIVVWWEARRIPYNLLIGVVGIVSFLLVIASAIVWEKFLRAPMEMLPDSPLFGFLVTATVYGIMANVCYTGGWIAEIAAMTLWKEDAQHFGPICFMLGVIFSVVLTLFPGIVIVIILLINLARGL